MYRLKQCKNMTLIEIFSSYIISSFIICRFTLHLASFAMVGWAGHVARMKKFKTFCLKTSKENTTWEASEWLIG